MPIVLACACVLLAGVAIILACWKYKKLASSKQQKKQEPDHSSSELNQVRNRSLPFFLFLSMLGALVVASIFLVFYFFSLLSPSFSALYVRNDLYRWSKQFSHQLVNAIAPFPFVFVCVCMVCRCIVYHNIHWKKQISLVMPQYCSSSSMVGCYLGLNVSNHHSVWTSPFDVNPTICLFAVRHPPSSLCSQRSPSVLYMCIC